MTREKAAPQTCTTGPHEAVDDTKSVFNEGSGLLVPKVISHVKFYVVLA